MFNFEVMQTHRCPVDFSPLPRQGEMSYMWERYYTQQTIEFLVLNMRQTNELTSCCVILRSQESIKQQFPLFLEEELDYRRYQMRS